MEITKYMISSFLLLLLVIPVALTSNQGLLEASEDNLVSLDGAYIRIIAEGFDGVLEGYLVDGDKLYIEKYGVVPLRIFDGFNYTVEVIAYGYLMETIRLNGSPENLSLMLRPAPLIHGYVYRANGRPQPLAIISIDRERKIYVASDSNGYFAIYSPYDVGTPVNITVYPVVKIWTLDNFFMAVGPDYFLDVAGWMNLENYTFYTLPYLTIYDAALPKSIDLYNVSGMVNILNVTLSPSMYYELEDSSRYSNEEFSLPEGVDDLRYTVLRAEWDPIEGMPVTREDTVLNAYGLGLLTGLPTNVPIRVTLYVIPTSGIDDIKPYVDEFSVGTGMFSRLILPIHEFTLDCDPLNEFCFNGLIIDYDKYFTLVEGRVTTASGPIPDNLYIIFRGRTDAIDDEGFIERTFYSIQRIEKDGTFKAILPSSKTSTTVNYWISYIDRDGRVTDLVGRSIYIPNLVSRYNVGTLNVPITVSRITGVISDYQDIPEDIDVFLLGTSTAGSDDDPLKNIRLQGKVYDDGSFEVYAIRSLVKDGTTYVYSYTLDLRSNFYCQLSDGEVDIGYVSGDISIGNVSCISGDLKPMRIDLYASSPPPKALPMRFVFFAPAMVENSTLAMNMEDLDSQPFWILQSPRLYVETVPDENGYAYPVVVRYGLIYRELNSSSGSILMPIKTIPGVSTEIRITSDVRILSGDLVVSEGYAGKAIPTQYSGLRYITDSDEQVFIEFLLTLDTEGMSQYRYLIIHTPQVIPEFEPPTILLLVLGVAAAIPMLLGLRRTTKYLSKVK